MVDLFDMTGKVALVTGGSRGLGYAMVKAFAEHGADVVIASRKMQACEAVAREVEAMGRRALPYSCHVGHWQELEGLVEAAYRHFGKVDVLVNNAGMSPVAPSSVAVGEDLFDKTVGVNFKGPFRLSVLVGSRMYQGEGGSIINISSTGALRPSPVYATYAGAKAALNAITVALAAEYAPKVRVNVISPGQFATDIAKSWPAGHAEKTRAAMRRIGRPEEIVTTALYLASSYTSFTTGALIRVDGGLP
jgi:NAD(P)-dependent dehydrogenase (short-subunit alcohol dehydrogenase family)